MIDDDKLDALIERAAQRGAKAALESIGLNDDKAGTDVRDLRQLLVSWREARATVTRTVAQVITTAILALLAAGLLFKTGGGGGGH